MNPLRFRRSTVSGRAPFDASALLAPVAYTKVRPPVLRDDAIARGRLLQAVHQIVERYPLLLVSAPAGYGKTTLLASVPIACPDSRLAWVTLDEDDNEPVRFLNAVVASLSALDPGLAERSTRALAEPRTVLDALINELAGAHRDGVVLVLDDLHQIEEPDVLDYVARLAERLPRSMRLAIASRDRPRLPIARWKARRILSELGPEELAFTCDEAKEYLSFAHGLDVSRDVACELADRAEGWPAGVTLLASAGCPTAGAPDERDIDSLIEQEVLEGLRPELRAFLLETSILPELTPALCQAVTERANARLLFHELQRRNLFVSSRGRSSDGLRYHELFRRSLERRLLEERPESVPELQRRAERARERARAHAPAVSVPETGEVLTPREVDVLRLVAAGASNAEIAEKLFISVHTVKRHVANLLDKLGVDSRARAAVAARRLGVAP